MPLLSNTSPIDYLVIGHLSLDITEDGNRLGGTAAYSALTAHALGLRVGILTSWVPDIPLSDLEEIKKTVIHSDTPTTFENIIRDGRRIQIIHSAAPTIETHMIPEIWREAPIVHLGPIAQEVDPKIIRRFPNSFIGATLQGWLRDWDHSGIVKTAEWPEANFVLQQLDAAIISIEDVGENEERIEEMVSSSRVFVVTEGKKGSRSYWNGDVRSFRPPEVNEIDATGAGDIYAAAFFLRLYQTKDPWESARFATHIASFSIQRKGLLGIPEQEEIYEASVEVI